MLATLVIGLREGLEASLIIGIIAAFLRTNGKPLRPMWMGVIAAMILSIGGGVLLEAVSVSLPQAQQEGLETVIGVVAVVFVTGMIVWMSTHARGMRKQLEKSAGAALGEGTAWALAGMAFLAVLKEGLETVVFLLATFQSSTSVVAAAAGAVIGILLAVGIGIGIYRGGVRLNLGRFFAATGVFLVFVAAGLVVSALRTAHEAGWLNIGQAGTLDLSWLAPNGSVQAALVTGVLGIPADPRLVEVLGWVLYLVPVLAYTLWPASLKPSAGRTPAVQLGLAGALAAAALVLLVAVPVAPVASAPASAPLVGADGAAAGTARVLVSEASAVLSVTGEAPVRFGSADRSEGRHANTAAANWRREGIIHPADRPATVTIEDLAALEDGRLPVGLNAQQNPGPFTAAWTQRTVRSAWTVGGGLLDATSNSNTILTFSGGGLPFARTFSVGADSWRVAPDHVSAVSAAGAMAERGARERLLWALWLPLVFAAAAILLAARGVRGRLRTRESPAGSRGTAPVVLPSRTPSPPRSHSYAAK